MKKFLLGILLLAMFFLMTANATAFSVRGAIPYGVNQELDLIVSGEIHYWQIDLVQAITPTNGYLHLDSLGSSFDTYFDFYDQNEVWITGNDDGGVNYTSVLNFGIGSSNSLTLNPGTYYLGLRGYNSTQYGNYILNSEITSPVPLPGAVWLLGSCIVGLIGIRRKKKA